MNRLRQVQKVFKDNKTYPEEMGKLFKADAGDRTAIDEIDWQLQEDHLYDTLRKAAEAHMNGNPDLEKKILTASNLTPQLLEEYKDILEFLKNEE